MEHLKVSIIRKFHLNRKKTSFASSNKSKKIKGGGNTRVYNKYDSIML